MKHQQIDTADSTAGFTLIEVFVVVAIVGILSTIAAPSWFSFLEGNRLTTSRDQIHSAIRQAQIIAQSRGLTWQFSIRERNDFVEWAVHQPVAIDEAQWEVSDSASVQIDDETSFASSGDVRYVRFDEDGNVERLGRITLSSEQAPTIKRCVIVSTLIGAMRKSKEQSVPNTGGNTCY
ncbi:general secretion pathway protein H [Synechococcus sp. PCC 7335]|uniref:prepilin-type N-terminal cleavage/methylation domain-containing protein n=1 Tax=Synechococcus sp. (strain ATCC 29403 / PCC 7335) TaxID=91464 RepID=UPI00017ECE22|nr:prepilin-type N-terminal cleavage/methylation domain-containing protein [Synechococcus sp. PCC 7335]EDX86705.1 general secretion pathway protein H [Synechococcus sp. PCC 7335]